MLYHKRHSTCRFGAIHQKKVVDAKSMKTISVTNSQYFNLQHVLQLYTTGLSYTHEIESINVGVEWHMWKKPIAVYNYIRNLPDSELILYCDATDVTLNDTPQNITQLYEKHFENKVVFNAEWNPIKWKDKSKIAYKSHTLGKHAPYINAGVFMGRVQALRPVLKQWISTFSSTEEFFSAGTSGCDQAPLIHCWNNHPELPITIDSAEQLMVVAPRDFEKCAIHHHSYLPRPSHRVKIYN